MKPIDSSDERLNELAQAIDESLALDRPAAWAPAFAAADGKATKEVPIEPLTDAGSAEVTGTAVATEDGEAVARAGSFAGLVKGWLGRA